MQTPLQLLLIDVFFISLRHAFSWIFRMIHLMIYSFIKVVIKSYDPSNFIELIINYNYRIQKYFHK